MSVMRVFLSPARVSRFFVKSLRCHRSHNKTLLNHVKSLYEYDHVVNLQQRRTKSDDRDQNSLFIPVTIKSSVNTDDINVGEELGGQLNKGAEILIKTA